MTILMLLVSLGLSALTGLCLVGACWPKQLPRGAWWLAGSIAMSLGFGISSCGALAWRIWGWSIPGTFVFIDAGLLAGLGWLWWRRDRNQPRRRCDERSLVPPVRAATLDYVMAVLFGLTLVAAVTSTALAGLRHPHGQWDAWALWNVKAKFLYHGHEHWAAMFSPPLYHGDYPLLLPLSIARLWCYQGSSSTLVPQTLAVLWPLLIVAVLVATVALRQGVRSASVAGVVLLATERMLAYSSWQYADIPLSLFMLIAMVLTSLWCRWPEKGRALPMLIGLSAGCAAWTKNEGLLFAVALCLALMFVTAMSRCPVRPVLARYVLGLMPFLFVVFIMKLAYAGSSDLFVNQTLRGLVARSTDVSRHYEIVNWTARSVHHLPDGAKFLVGQVPILLVLLVVYGCSTGITRNRADGQAVATIGLTLLLMAGGYYTTYLIARDDLTWHLKTSHGRLLMHLWPCIVLMMFVAFRSPNSGRVQSAD